MYIAIQPHRVHAPH